MNNFNNKHSRETHFLKIGRMLVYMDLIILNHDRIHRWFEGKHRQETVASLHDAIGVRIREHYDLKHAEKPSRGQQKEKKTTPDPPHMIQGDNVKIGYKFTHRPVTQRCLFMKSNVEAITLFPETLHVYVCEYEPAPDCPVISPEDLPSCDDSGPAGAVGTSNYFRPELSLEKSASVVKKRNRLRRIIGRQNASKPLQTKDPASTVTGSKPPLAVPVRDTDQSRRMLSPTEGDSSSDVSPIINRTGSHMGSLGECDQLQRRYSDRAATYNGEAVSKLDDSTNPSGDKPWVTLTSEMTIGLNGDNTCCTLPAFQGTSDERVNKLCTDGEDVDDVCSVITSVEEDDHHGETGDVGLDPEVINLEENDDHLTGGGGGGATPPDPGIVARLSLHQLRQLVRRNSQYLKQIFVGKRTCQRHKDYKQGGYSRACLSYEACYGPYTEEQVECIMKELVKMYCSKHQEYLDYICKVLLPEAMTKICIDTLHISPDQARGILQTMPLCGDATLLGTKYKSGFN